MFGVIWYRLTWPDLVFCLVAVQLGAFDAVVKQMLEDVQERLVYRTHIYIQTDITGYNPAPGDLAYPEKLEMMEVGLVFWNVMAYFYVLPLSRYSKQT